MVSADKSAWVRRCLKALPAELQEHLLREGRLAELPAGAVLLQVGQYVRAVPVVLSGRVKVYLTMEDRRLLLYYIRPEESCVMSFSAVLEGKPSQIVAEAEEDTAVLLISSDDIPQLLRAYPVLNLLFFRQYQQRYAGLLDNIGQVLFHRLDERLLSYLQERCRLTGQRIVEVTHRELAEDLGTVREVITRTLKKLEAEGLVRSLGDGAIEVC